MHRDGEVDSRRLLGWLDDEDAEEAPPDLLRRDLVRVVPERSYLLDPESVRVALAGEDSVLRDAGDPILGVRDVHAVPVDRHPFLDILVLEHHFDVVALSHTKLRPRRHAVEGQRLDAPTRCQSDRRAPRDQREARVRGSHLCSVEIGHAEPSWSVCIVGRGLGASAEVVRAV